ncbi:hypothetical protein FB45DRAFT_1027412 [Roridomyces roridus]|uniref:F-box domain-containing protein n=1 Tax=Roridomyces roridus TaxID=1738132 RepID=A0AAD7FKV9_9AGAR|nr:hypothetical protein FB45DRAFT_1027412 [Roridomyces roridus]
MATTATQEFLNSSAAALRARLAALGHEMAGLESRLRLLTAERDVVVYGLGAIVYPVLTLPPEIMGEIFSHYVENPHIGYTQDPGRGPLLLASVCRSWREICLSIHPFWSNLRIFPPRVGLDAFLSRTECWLSRAGDEPLDLEISRSASTQAVLSFLSRRSTQLRTLKLALDATLANAEMAGRLPLLEKLSIGTSMDHQHDWPIMTCFRDTPSLREVQLSIASPRWISLPWSQLLSLELTTTNLFNGLEVLRQTQDLRALTVYLTNRTIYTSRDDPRPLILAHLRTLNFLYSGDGLLLDHLTLPALESLQCSYLNDEGANRLMSLASRSSWPLRRIRLANTLARAYIPCLRYTPSVEEVEIYHRQYTARQLFELLATDTEEFLPALRALTIADGTADISYLNIPEMVRARKRGPMRCFGYSFTGHSDLNKAAVEGIRDRLRSLVGEELKVELTEY